MTYNKELEKSIENNLFELYCKDFRSGRDGEVFSALTHSIREKISKKWFDSLKISNRSKRLYVLSFEYSFGDKLIKNLIKLNLLDEVKEILKHNNKDFNSINSQDIDFALGFSDLGDWTNQLIESLTNSKLNIFSYGLRYRRGMLRQEIINGQQVEKPQEWKVNKNPWEHEKAFSHKIDFGDYSVSAIAYDLPILSYDGEYANTVRLWKSNSLNNLNFEKFSQGEIIDAYKDINKANSIVEFLYPSENSINGRKLRLTQEYFFASASIQDILKRYKKYTDNDISKMSEHVSIQITDSHPILSILVFIDLVMKKYHKTFDEALEIAKSVFVFVHMNLLPESFEKWELEFVKEICPNLIPIIEKINRKITLKSYGISNELEVVKFGKVDMLNIAYFVSKKIFTTSNDRLEQIKNIYLVKQYNEYKDKIGLTSFDYYFDQFVKKINADNEKINFTKNNFNEKKVENKKSLIKDFCLDGLDYNLKSPFIMHLGVFHENKRQLLTVLSIAYLYFKLKKNPNLDIPERTYVFAGKSYANYFIAKETIKLIISLRDAINNDMFIKDKIKIIFIENYDLTKENKILPACDMFLNLNRNTMSSNEVQLKKAILSGSNLVLTNSNETLDEKYFTYKFSKTTDKIENNIVDFININSEIKEFFDFYKTFMNGKFYNGFENIRNSILYYNDAYDIVRDLSEFTEKIEHSIKDYILEEKWSENILQNIDHILSQNIDNSKYFENLEA